MALLYNFSDPSAHLDDIQQSSVQGHWFPKLNKKSVKTESSCFRLLTIYKSRQLIAKKNLV